MVLTSLLALPLVGALAVAPAPADAPPGYAAALERASEADAWSNDHYKAKTVEAIERLRVALRDLEPFEEQLLGDEVGRDLVLELRLNLARVLLRHGDDEEAWAIIDDLLRLPDEARVPFQRFGYDMVHLAERRTLALESKGKGHITVLCHQDCFIVVGGQPVLRQELELYLGRYQVEVRATADGGPPSLAKTVELVERDQVVALEFGEPPQPEPPPEPEVTPEPTPPPPPRPELPPPARMLPRWAEITGIAVGVGLAALGPGLLSVDGKCKDLDQAITQCPKIWESTPGGAVSLAVGVGVATAATLLLVIDERRTRPGSRRRARLDASGVLRF